MTTDRFQFQRDCAARVTGRILNIGCKEDPAGLQQTYPDRVINLDIREEDEDQLNNHGRHVPIPVDVVHDATVIPWPFKDDEFDLVIFGDMLEDLPDDGCQYLMLEEARRVGKHVCVTTPEDDPERDAHHQTTVTEEKLKTWLDIAGWRRVEFNVVNYGFVPRGYFTFCERTETPAEMVEAAAAKVEAKAESEDESDEG